jgi:hypothetical protein
LILVGVSNPPIRLSFPSYMIDRPRAPPSTRSLAI